MKKWLITITTFLLISLSSSVWALSVSDQNAAKKVIENWFSAMQAKQVDQAANFLAPQFISLHTDGIVRNKSEEIELMKNLNMKSHHLVNFNYSESGNIVIVTYIDQGVETIDNKYVQPLAATPRAASRMAVLQKQNGRWVIIAYSNFDRIG